MLALKTSKMTGYDEYEFTNIEIPTNIQIIGPRGSGKTTLIKYLILKNYFIIKNINSNNIHYIGSKNNINNLLSSSQICNLPNLYTYDILTTNFNDFVKTNITNTDYKKIHNVIILDDMPTTLITDLDSPLINLLTKSHSYNTSIVSTVQYPHHIFKFINLLFDINIVYGTILPSLVKRVHESLFSMLPITKFKTMTKELNNYNFLLTLNTETGIYYNHKIDINYHNPDAFSSQVSNDDDDVYDIDSVDEIIALDKIITI